MLELRNLHNQAKFKCMLKLPTACRSWCLRNVIYNIWFAKHWKWFSLFSPFKHNPIWTHYQEPFKMDKKDIAVVTCYSTSSRYYSQVKLNKSTHLSFEYWDKLLLTCGEIDYYWVEMTHRLVDWLQRYCDRLYSLIK